MKKLFTSFTLALLALSAYGQNTLEVGLTWNPNPEPTVTKYRLYRGDTPGKYNWTNDVGLTTVTKAKELLPGRTYYFALTAWADFIESDKSNELMYSTPDAVETTTPVVTKTVRTLTDITITWELPPTNQFVQRWTVSYAIKNKGPQPSVTVTEPKVVINTANITDVYEIFIVAEGLLDKSPAAYLEVPNIPQAPVGLEIVPGSLKVVYPSVISQ